MTGTRLASGLLVAGIMAAVGACARTDERVTGAQPAAAPIPKPASETLSPLVEMALPNVEGKTFTSARVIERLVNRLKQFRVVATRYDKTAESFLAFVHLAAARVWMRFVHTA